MSFASDYFRNDLIVPGVAAPPAYCPGPGSPAVECSVPGARVAVEGYFPGLPGPGASVVTAGTRGTLCVTTSRQAT